jgi:DNA-binding NarL/FixJ family response regulator
VQDQRIRILVVDDYDPWRRFAAETFSDETRFSIVAEAADGDSAVEKAQALQPDLILLDIGLPGMNGIEAARQIRKSTPNAKILFVSENRSWDIAEEALGTGARGYVLKSDAGSQLVLAVEAVVQGKCYLSTSLARDKAAYTDGRAAVILLTA